MSEPLPSPPQPVVDAAPGGIEPLQILWIGDASLAQRFVSRRAPHMQIRAGDAASVDAQLKLLAPGENPLDLLVIDATIPSINPNEILSKSAAAGLDLPVVLLTGPGQEDVAAKVGRLAVCDCIVKTQDFILQLLPTIAQVRARHDLVGVLIATRQREERLRAVLESQPAITGVVNPDGRIAAMNRAGLAYFGGSAEQVVGRDFVDFVPQGERDTALQLFRPADHEHLATLEHSLLCLDGSVRPVRTSVVALPRVDGMLLLVTVEDRSEWASAAASDADQGRLEQQAERAQLIEDIGELRSRFEAVDGERQRLVQTLRERDELHKAARQESEREQDRIATALNDATSRYESLAAQRHEWEHVVAAYEQQGAALRDIEVQRAAELTALHDADADRVRLAQALQDSQAQCAAFDAEWSAERAQWNRATETAAAERAAQVQWLEAEQQRLAAAAQWAEHERQNISAELQEARARIEALNAERQQWEQATTEALASHAYEAESAAALRLECERFGSAVQAAEYERQHLSDELQEARVRIEALSAERQQWEQATTEALASHAYEAELAAALRLECERVSSAVQAAEYERQHISAELQEARARIEALNAERQQWEQATTEALASHAYEAESAAALRLECERVGSAVQAAEYERQQTSAELQEARARIEALNAERQQWADATNEAQASRDHDAATMARLESERDLLTVRLEEALTQRGVLEADHSIALAHVVAQAEAAGADYALARQSLESECRRLASALREVEERHAEAKRSAAREHLDPLPLERAALDAARARSQHLVEELAALQATLRRATAREEAAAGELAAAEERLAAMASRMDRALEDDQRGLVELRRDLMQFLCDADSRCKALMERRASAREDWAR